MSNGTGAYPIGSLFGIERSGTTWLGAILSSHPEIAYRFEPLHRLKETNPEARQLLEQIRSGQFSSSDLPRLYQTLIPAYAACEKPPFFPKTYRTLLPAGRSLLWYVARKKALGDTLFRTFYSPKDTPLLIFKEVALGNVFRNLLNGSGIPMVYIMRHPCAVVWSIMRGQKAALMPAERRTVLKNLLEKYNPALAEQYGSRLETLAVSEQQALLWRIDVEMSLEACEASSNGLFMIYEDLVEQPIAVSTQVFQHFGLEMCEQSLRFIEESTQGTSGTRLKRWEFGIHSYFTVFRDSKASSTAWKKDMPLEEQQRVIDMVKDSQPFRMAVDRGSWEPAAVLFAAR